MGDQAPHRSHHQGFRKQPLASRRGFTNVRYQVASTAIIVAVVVLASELIDYFTKDDPPKLYYAALYGDRLDEYTGMLAIGHNSGNTVGSSKAALEYGADVIEIDVRPVNGQLRVAHSSPMQFFGEYVSTAPGLGAVWPAANGSRAVQVDVKSSAPSFVNRLLDFLRDNEAPGTTVILTSRSMATLERAQEEYPNAVRLLSIESRVKLEEVLANPDVSNVIDGISVAEPILDEESALELDARGVVTFAWVVNDLETLNRLAGWGVDGIITDNLAIIELLAYNRAEGDDAVTRILKQAMQPAPDAAKD